MFLHEYKYTDRYGRYLYSKMRIDRDLLGSRRKFTQFFEYPQFRHTQTWVPYNYPQIYRCIEQGIPFLMAEGEKDAQKLIDLGYPATSLFDSKMRDEYRQVFKDARILILKDEDKEGDRRGRECIKFFSQFCSIYDNGYFESFYDLLKESACQI